MSEASGSGADEALARAAERLARNVPATARVLLDASPGDARVVEGPRGGRTVAWQDTLLASAYDPEGEGRRLAEGMDDGPVDLLVAVGLGLGHHLEAFHERHPCPVLVYEPSPSRLRAAVLARPDMPLLACEDVFVTCDAETMRDWVAARYTAGLRLKVFPHPAVLRVDAESVRAAVSRISRVKESVDLLGRTRALMAERWAETTIANAGHLVRTPSLSSLFDAFPGVPAVVCAAGPSLDRQLPALAAARDRVLVIAIGQSLRALHEAGIEPDLVHVVERENVGHQLERAGDLGRVNLVLPPQAHPALFEIPVGRRLLAWQASNPFGCWIAGVLGEARFPGTGGTVAQCAVHLAAELGADPILLIGQDLAFTDGRVYAASSCYGEVGFEPTGGDRFEFTNLRRKWGPDYATDRLASQLVWVEGWHGERVPTDTSYATFREVYGDLGRDLATRGIRLWNCTEGGARIPGLEHWRFGEALAHCARTSVDRGPLHALTREAPRPATGRFREPLRRARRALDRVEARLRRGARTAEAAGKALFRATPREALDWLRRLDRLERRLRRDLVAVPFLDALAQRGVHEFDSRSRRAQTREPTPQDVVEELQLLLQAAREAVPKARQLLDAFEENVAEPSPASGTPS